jgi:hypothetical protein
MKCVISDQRRINIFHRSILKLGKINEDIAFCASAECVTIFTSNTTRSARPVIRYKTVFFSQYEYEHDSENLIYQITVKSITDALKDLSSPEYLVLEIIPTQSTLVMTITDKFRIVHKYNLYLQEAITTDGGHFGNTLFQTAKLTINFESLKEMENAFKKTNNMMIAVIKYRNVHYVRFMPDDDDQICHSDLKIRNNPACKIEVTDNTVYPLTLSYSDFRHVLKITSSFGPKFELYTSFPGSPIVIRANHSNCAEIESALATMSTADTSAESTQDIDVPKENIEKPPEVPVNPKILGHCDNEQKERKQESERELPLPEPPKIPLPMQMSQSLEEWSQSQQSTQSQTSFKGTQVVPWPGLTETDLKPAKRSIMTISASQSDGTSLSDE